MRDTTKQPPTDIQTQVFYIPQSSVPTYPTQPVQRTEGWWNLNKRNKPQSNSVGTVSLIFISGGMNMAWCLGFSLAPITYYVLTKHIILSWFIGGIIGAFIGAFVSKYVPKKLLMGFSSILVTVCGSLQVFDPNSYHAILASRYFNGIAVGIVFPMTFILIGEEVVKPLRGMNAATVDIMCLSCGIFIQVIYSTLWSNDIEDSFQSIQISGILNIIFGVVSFITGYFLIIESPVFYLARGNEQMAIDSLRRLQKPFTITSETYEQLEEHKLYLAECQERSIMQNAAYGIPALIKLCFYRSFMALGFSYFINFTFTYSSLVTSQFQVYPFLLYAFARWIGSLIASFTIDSKGRKPTVIVGFFFCTILAFTVGGIFYNKQHLTDIGFMNTAKYLLIFYQLFVSMSLVSSSTYLSEAFPLTVKSYFIATVFILEMLVQIIIICSKDFFFENIFHISDYFLALGGLSFMFMGLAVFALPETKQISLRECLPKFRQWNNFRL